MQFSYPLDVLQLSLFLHFLFRLNRKSQSVINLTSSVFVSIFKRCPLRVRVPMRQKMDIWNKQLNLTFFLYVTPLLFFIHPCSGYWRFSYVIISHDRKDISVKSWTQTTGERPLRSCRVFYWHTHHTNVDTGVSIMTKLHEHLHVLAVSRVRLFCREKFEKQFPRG